jgi:hypothetical protein
MKLPKDEIKAAQWDFIGARQKSWHIFEGNYKDLRGACDLLATPNTTFVEKGVKYVMHTDAYSKTLDVERKFYNFLASAKTLVDHTRVLMKKYENTPAYHHFEKKREALRDSAIVIFCHDLRNYFVHQDNPVNNYFSHGTYYEDEGLMVIQNFARISKESLESHTKWSATSKQIIRKMEEPLEVSILAERYFDAVSALNNWLNNEFPAMLGQQLQLEAADQTPMQPGRVD